MRTAALRLADRVRRLAPCRLLAGVAAVLAPLAVPGQAPAQECRLDDINATVLNSDILERMVEHLDCLQGHLDSLRAENAALKNRLDVLEDERAAPAAAYRNRDGEVDRKDRYLGPATFVLTGDRRGGPRSLALDRALVLAMCGDADGCLASLGLKGVVVDGEPVEAMFSTGPCALHLDPARGAWALSGLCAEDALPPAAGAAQAGQAGQAAQAGEPGEPAPSWGRDGDAKPFGDAAREGRIVLGFAGACFLAEAEPRTRGRDAGAIRFQPDARPGLFLIAGGAAWDPTGAFPTAHLPLGPTDPDFECRLTFRD